MNAFTLSRRTALTALTLTGTLAVTAWAATTNFNVKIGDDRNKFQNDFVQPQDPALSGGGRDQTLKAGDILFGTSGSDTLVGNIGTDLLVGGSGDDVLVGGIEHFNPENRDRAFGSGGSDVFLWKPGDGSDFFDGGRGIDVVVFGIIGEVDDQGALEFAVKNDQLAGNIFLGPNGLPVVDVTNSPGFCEVIDDSTDPTSASELDSLGLDHLVRFFIRSIANDFAAGVQDTDNGLRVTLHLKDVEFLVCTDRDGGLIEVLDMRTSPPTPSSLNAIPNAAIQTIVQ